jgi:hypothetical protein
MKKLIVAALLVVGMTAFAQVKKQPEPNSRPMEKLSAEQRSQLELKKMTLDLDLNAEQQKEMGKIIVDQQAKREAKRLEREAHKKDNTKPTADQIFAMKNQMLDEQIATKEKVKKILTPEQLKKWETIRESRANMRSHRMDRKHGKNPMPKE